MKKWYKYKYFWRRGDADGDDSPQDRDDGTGDLIFNTMSKIVRDRDNSEWAIKSFLACGKLLRERKRWPDEFNTEGQAPGIVVWKLWLLRRWIQWKVFNKWHDIIRSQNDMTRDPFIAYGSCYAHLMRNWDSNFDRLTVQIDFCSTRLPWYLYRPEVWTWWRRLRVDNRKHYVKRLSFLRASAVVDYYEHYYADEFYKDTV